MSMSSGAMRSLETAQKKGSTILNLKCVDAQVVLFSKMFFALCCFCWNFLSVCL